MTWLGHHEFGLDHRPFVFNNKPPSLFSTDTLDYWLRLWCETYEWLEKTKPNSALFICYEDLCTHKEIWARLAAHADITDEHYKSDYFKLSSRNEDIKYDQQLGDHASIIYARLVKQSRELL